MIDRWRAAALGGLALAVVASVLFSAMFIYPEKDPVTAFNEALWNQSYCSVDFGVAGHAESAGTADAAGALCLADLRRIDKLASEKRYVTWQEVQNIAPCCASDMPHRDVSLEDVLFVVSTTAAEKDKLDLARKTWAKSLPHVIFVSDEDDPSVPLVSPLPSADIPNEAGSRPLAYLQQLRTIDDPVLEQPYILFTQSDSFINIDRLLRLLRGVNPRCALLLGSVNNRKELPDLDFADGAASILATSECFRRILPLAFSGACPYEGRGDTFLAQCAWRQRCQIVHSYAFSAARPDAMRWEGDYTWSRIVESVSFGGVTETDAVDVEKYLKERRAALADMTKP